MCLHNYVRVRSFLYARIGLANEWRGRILSLSLIFGSLASLIWPVTLSCNIVVCVASESLLAAEENAGKPAGGELCGTSFQTLGNKFSGRTDAGVRRGSSFTGENHLRGSMMCRVEGLFEEEIQSGKGQVKSTQDSDFAPGFQSVLVSLERVIHVVLDLQSSCRARLA